MTELIKKKPSPTRTYVVPIEINGYQNFAFKKFVLPEGYNNTCEAASWYFYNRLDGFSCGLEAYSFEDHMNIIEAKE